MSKKNKEEWKQTGKDTGEAFKSLGKAINTTAKVAFTDESNYNGEGKKTKTGEAWTEVGHDFAKAGKSLGKSTKGLFEDDEPNVNKDEAIDVEFEEEK